MKSLDLAFAASLLSLCSCSEGRCAEFVRGDSDNSGAIDLTDAVNVLGFLFLGGDPYTTNVPRCADASDADDSGTLDITDGIYLLGYLFTGGPAPKPPTPSSTDYNKGSCGSDTTSDDLTCEGFLPCNALPIAHFLADRERGEVPLRVAFDASSSSDADGAIVQYIWEFGDGTSISGVDIQKVVRTYIAEGTHAITLRVVDDKGASAISDPFHITVEGNLLPIARFTAEPSQGYIPLEVRFDATSSADPGGQIVAWEWDFGDGSPKGDAVEVTHTYTQKRDYTVRLTVLDGQGAESEITSIVRTFCPPPKPPKLGAYSAFVRTDRVTLQGTVDPASSSLVEVVGPVTFETSSADPITGVFSIDVPLGPSGLNRVNQIFVKALSICDQERVESCPVVATVTHDAQLPHIFIDSPKDNAVFAGTTVDVMGRVGDLLSGQKGMKVFINDVNEAVVDVGIGNNGTFLATGVPLSPDAPTTIEVIATDALGNSASDVVTVKPLLAGQRLEIRRGNAQKARILEYVEQPIEALALLADGITPIPDKLVTFEVTRSNGRLWRDKSLSEGSLVYQTRTDAEGIARAFWRLGSDAGCGNNRVVVSATGFNDVTFCASATPGLNLQINVGSGNNQKAETGATAPEPLRAWVSDSCNPVSGMPVDFRVISGAGQVNDAEAVKVSTDQTGHAAAGFTFGQTPGTTVVEANFPDNPGVPATFILTAISRNPTRDTTFTGLVLDNANQPIVGALCYLEFPGHEELPQDRTSSEGQFTLLNLPASGRASLTIDGSTATAIDGRTFPSLTYEVIIVPEAENSLPKSILLPALDSMNSIEFDGSRDVELTVVGIAGLKMTVRAGTVITPYRGELIFTGSGRSIRLSLNQVHHDDIPMPIADGAAPPFAWTLQPARTTFDPPIDIEYPNMSGLSPGAIANFLTYNHDTGKFEVVTTGHVTEDGASIKSDRGSGLSISGWGCVCPPYALTGKCAKCNPIPDRCSWSPDCHNTRTWDCNWCFTPACNTHDICYGVPGVPRIECDKQFLENLRSICNTRCDAGTDTACLHCDDTDAHCNECREHCLELADIYYDIVQGRVGGPAYTAAQRDTTRCLERNGLLELPTELQDGIINDILNDVITGCARGSEEDPSDLDGDLIPDSWEIEFGLDPLSCDATRDFDADGLSNLTEHLAGTDPLKSDSNANGITDLEEFQAVQDSALTSASMRDGLWTATVNGQSVIVNSDGTFEIGNIPAVDADFPPDGKSDALYRVEASSQGNGRTIYGISDPFHIEQGRSISVETVLIGYESPRTPASIRADLPEKNRLEGTGDSVQVRVEATFAAPCGTPEECDISGSFRWTTYRTSNPSIATVSKEGVITARTKAGIVVITATNFGATSAVKLKVTIDESTTIEGLVQRNDGTQVVGALIRTNFSEIPDVFTNEAGFFSIQNVPSDLATTIVVTATKAEGGIELSGSASVVPRPGMIADIGSIVVTCSPITISQPCTEAVGTSPHSVVAADFDSDGLQDLATADSKADQISILINESQFGLCQFMHSSESAVGFPRQLVAADMNGDALVDIVVIMENSAEVIVKLNDGMRHFPVKHRESTGGGSRPRSLSVADFNGDGILDVAAANSSSSKIIVFRGDGLGILSMERELPLAQPSEAPAIASADLNNDGVADLVSTNLSDIESPHLSTFLGIGIDGFQQESMVPLPRPSGSIALGDIDSDGNIDLVTAYAIDDSIGLVYGTGQGNFRSPINVEVGNYINHVAVYDIRGCGALDIVVAVDNRISQTNDRVVVLSNAIAVFEHAVGGAPIWSTIADIDANGLGDLVVANEDSDSISILLRQ